MTSPDPAEGFPEPAARIGNRAGRAPVLLLCDHASNAVPAAFDSLGLGAEQLGSHIAFDPGAAALTEALAQAIDAAYVLCGYSRLLIDVNRDPDAADSIVVENDGIRVPGNAALDAAERAARVERVYEPYHAAIEDALAERVGAAGTQLVVGVHSFTPRMGGVRRPWDIGLIFHRDRRLARALVAELVGLGERERLTVGLNEPYSPDDRVYHTLDRHAESRGLPCVMIELPNDQLATSDGRARWAERLAGALRDVAPAFQPYAAPGGDRRATGR